MVPNGEFYNRPVADLSTVACPHCDLLQRLPELAPGDAARCPRCDEELSRFRPDSVDRTLALTIAAAILYVIANTVPMLGLSIVGRNASTTVLGGAQQLWNDDRVIVAVLVLFTAVIAPALQIALTFAIVMGARRRHPRRWVGAFLRYHHVTRIWSMVEVMMLGVLVALTKIADYATVVPGLALYALAVLIFVLAAMQSSFDPREVWNRIEWAGSGVEAELDA